jgi:CheY-like chemotaxis protein
MRPQGVSAVAELRRRGYAHLVIGVTGNVMADDVAAYLAAGADKVLLKPLQRADLDELLRYAHLHGTRSLGPSHKLICGPDQELQWAPFGGAAGQGLIS